MATKEFKESLVKPMPGLPYPENVTAPPPPYSKKPKKVKDAKGTTPEVVEGGSGEGTDG